MTSRRNIARPVTLRSSKRKRSLDEVFSHFAAGAHCERRPLNSVSLHQPQIDGDALEQVDTAFHDRIEHRLHVGRRAADDPQDLRGRGLLVERLGDLAVARLQLLEQPRVLDRDHCLIGEGLQQRDLFLGELTDGGAADVDRADAASLPEHRGEENRSVAR